MSAEDEVMDDVEEGYIPEGGIQIGDIYIPPGPAPACTFDSNGPRLMITHIENHFYKSYAGKQVLGPFHKSFSSIVGPNGSGKSNVIDSMLFVFGFGGSKQRSKKLSNLIHNSEQHPNVKQCTVAVHFQTILDKGEDFEVVPDSQFVVARTAFKDNSSFYTLNGKRSQRKDVCKLLMEKGIDLDHNRFLILQGEVENISLMKPKALSEHDTGMLEFLEDIIGTSRFKVPIEKLSARVEELNELRVEKLNRVKLVEKEKDDLEGPMKEALGYIKMENEVVEKNHKLKQVYIYDADKNIEKANAKKEEIEASVSDLTAKMKEVSGKRKEKETEIKEAGVNFDKLEKEREDLEERFKKIEIEDSTIREELKSTNVKRKKVKQQVELEKSKKEKLVNLPEENRKKIEECESVREKLEKKVEEEEVNYETAMASLKTDTQAFQDEKAVHQTKLVDLKRKVNEASEELNLASSEHEVYISAEKKEQIRLFDLNQRIQTTKDAAVEKSARLSDLTQLIPTKEQEVATAQEELRIGAINFEQSKQRLHIMRSEYNEKRAAQSATQSQGAVLDSLMAQKRNGNIPGIIGRLGDLGAIDKKYDVAISTAVGGSLDKVLVDTTETGKKCIQFLKQNSIGRGNFLALDKTKGKWEQKMRPMKTPDDVPRLFDLITVADPSYSTAFYQSMRDTLVAKDMDEASKVAYGATRFRTVTLVGEMIEISGTMSGGGKQAFRGKMGQQVKAADTVSPKELQNMEKGITEVQSEVDSLNKRRGELENQTYKLNSEIKDLKKESGKLGVEVNPLKEQASMLERQVADQEKRVQESAPDKKQVAVMKKRIDKAQEVFDDADEGAKVVEKEVKSCDSKIKEITGGKIKGVQKKLDDTKKQLDKIKGEITKLTVEIKTTDRNLKKCDDKIESMDAEVKECEEKMTGMQTRRTTIEEEGTQVMNQITERKEQSKELREKIAEIKKTLDEVTKEENELKSSRIEVDQQLQKWDDAVKDNTKKVAYWKREMKKLCLQEVPGEELQDLVELTTEQMDEINAEELTMEIQTVQEKLQASKPNMAAIAEYKKKEEVYLARVAELDEMTAARDQQRKYHDEIRKQRLNDFMEGFSIITGKLKEMYQMITLGGDAELELVDSLDPFAEGIVFSVRPPKKSWKNISNLSGGEKTLSSLALVFALHYYKPTPLYVMDEIDAALDFKNVSIVANYIKERTKNAQFIIISLRSNMFELADRLVGIYKTYNCTKTVTINPGMVETCIPQPSLNLNAVPTPSKTATQSSSRPLTETSVNGTVNTAAEDMETT